MANFVDMQIAQIRETVGDRKVLLGLSGGVDSSVVAALIHRAIGDQLHVCSLIMDYFVKEKRKVLLKHLMENSI